MVGCWVGGGREGVARRAGRGGPTACAQPGRGSAAHQLGGQGVQQVVLGRLLGKREDSPASLAGGCLAVPSAAGCGRPPGMAPHRGQPCPRPGAAGPGPRPALGRRGGDGSEFFVPSLGTIPPSHAASASAPSRRRTARRRLRLCVAAPVPVPPPLRRGGQGGAAGGGRDSAAPPRAGPGGRKSLGRGAGTPFPILAHWRGVQGQAQRGHQVPHHPPSRALEAATVVARAKKATRPMVALILGCSGGQRRERVCAARLYHTLRAGGPACARTKCPSAPPSLQCGARGRPKTDPNPRLTKAAWPGGRSGARGRHPGSCSPACVPPRQPSQDTSANPAAASPGT